MDDDNKDHVWLMTLEEHYLYEIGWNNDLLLGWIGVTLGAGMGLFQTYDVNFPFISLASFSYLILIFILIFGIDQIINKVRVLTQCKINLYNIRKDLYGKSLGKVEFTPYQHLLFKSVTNPISKRRLLLGVCYFFILTFCVFLFLEKYSEILGTLYSTIT